MIDSSLIEVLNRKSKDHGSSADPLGASIDPLNLSKQLQTKVLRLKSSFLEEEDGSTNYSKLRESPAFSDFEEECEQLCYIDLKRFLMISSGEVNGPNSDMKSKAFFINIYNVLTFHALAKFVTTEKSVLELKNFWQKYAYQIGPVHIFSLDHIEHGILRCNKLHPTYNDVFFKGGDPRRELVLPELDPRIHFVLNCGARSCPIIRVLSPENLEFALEAAARSFCQNNVEIREEENCIVLSKIFLWYGSDFGAGEDGKAIVEKIKRHLTDGQREQLRKLRDDFQVKYADYDWSIC